MIMIYIGVGIGQFRCMKKLELVGIRNLLVVTYRGGIGKNWELTSSDV